MYKEIKDALTNKTRLKGLCNSLTSEELDAILMNMTEIREKRRIEEAEQEKAKQIEAEKIEVIKRQLEQQGLDVNTLINALQSSEEKTKKVRSRPEPKFEYMQDGVLKTWTGQGRTPKVIQDALDKGESLERFAIRKG
ncbi:H-NS family nucleoid-associated regulatory protein [Vibrio fluvialis]|uniref:H-NS histone family protein n=1 Tax=Vibrio fluvialis TaxID=676 RepID=UPI0013025394|nr:H-NS family nucleoid-associated regulatory protein [Vibrio fluvialis]